MKLLMWLALGLIVYWALRNQIKRQQQRGHTQFEQHSKNTSAPVENMVACAYCQLYLPASEAIHDSSSNQYFCSEEHAKLHASQQ
jgi:uncharacterized protein